MSNVGESRTDKSTWTLFISQHESFNSNLINMNHGGCINLLKKNQELGSLVTELKYHCEVYKLGLRSIQKVVKNQTSQSALSTEFGNKRFVAHHHQKHHNNNLAITQRKTFDKINRILVKTKTFIHGYSLLENHSSSSEISGKQNETSQVDGKNAVDIDINKRSSNHKGVANNGDSSKTAPFSRKNSCSQNTSTSNFVQYNTIVGKEQHYSCNNKDHNSDSNNSLKADAVDEGIERNSYYRSRSRSRIRNDKFESKSRKTVDNYLIDLPKPDLQFQERKVIALQKHDKEEGEVEEKHDKRSHKNSWPERNGDAIEDGTQISEIKTDRVSSIKMKTANVPKAILSMSTASYPTTTMNETTCCTCHNNTAHRPNNEQVSFSEIYSRRGIHPSQNDDSQITLPPPPLPTSTTAIATQSTSYGDDARKPERNCSSYKDCKDGVINIRPCNNICIPRSETWTNTEKNKWRNKRIDMKKEISKTLESTSTRNNNKDNIGYYSGNNNDGNTRTGRRNDYYNHHRPSQRKHFMFSNSYRAQQTRDNKNNNSSTRFRKHNEGKVRRVNVYPENNNGNNFKLVGKERNGSLVEEQGEDRNPEMNPLPLPLFSYLYKIEPSGAPISVPESKSQLKSNEDEKEIKEEEKVERLESLLSLMAPIFSK